MIAINNETSAKEIILTTALPAGRYFDVTHEGQIRNTRSGPVVTVGSHGREATTVAPKGSVALYALQRI